MGETNMALTSELYLARLRFADSFRRRIHFPDIIFRIDPIKPAIPMIFFDVSRGC